MTKSPAVRFGLAAMSVALSAKCRRVHNRDVADLLADALDYSATDRRIRQPVLDFYRNYSANPTSAGSALQDFIRDWMRSVAPETSHRFDWQKRADM
jgi:hypothetical protein